MLAIVPDSFDFQWRRALLQFYAHGSLDELTGLFADEKIRKENWDEYYSSLYGVGSLTAFETEISTWAEQSYRADFYDATWDAPKQAIVLKLLGESDHAKAVIDYIFEQAELRGDTDNGDFNLQIRLGWAYALSGENDKAKTAIDRAVAMRSESDDEMNGTRIAGERAAVLAWIGKKDAAVAELERLAKKPNRHTSYHLLKNSLDYYPLRDHPGFQALLEDSALKEPLPIKNY